MVQTETRTETTSAPPRLTSGDEVVAEAQQRSMSVALNVKPEVMVDLPERYKVETRRRRNRIRRAMRVGLVVAALMAITDLAALCLTVMETKSGEFARLVATSMVLIGGLLLILCAFEAIDAVWQHRRERAELVSAALEQGSVCMVGPLVELLNDAKRRHGAVHDLAELLPRLQPADAHLLTGEQLQGLCDVLRSGAREDHPLRLAILRAFAHIGDSSVLTLVERIADSPARTSRQRELKEEAQKCLPILKLRVQHEAASRTLLRAANVLTSAPDTLVRPATMGISSGSDHLLRPIE